MAKDRVTLRLDDVSLPIGTTHTYTDYQVATDIEFTNIIFESLVDSENKLLKTFYGDLVDKGTYYSRARMMLSTGYTKWTNYRTFTVNHDNVTNISLKIPIAIGTVKLTSSCDVKKHCLTDFTIYVSKPQVIGVVNFVSTTYTITDINENVVFMQENDEINVDKLLINSINLKSNTVYRIHVYRKTDSNMSSNISTLTIHTI